MAKRHSKANNKYCPDFDPKKPSTFISYLDMNNLQGWAMNEYLPYKGFKWLENIDNFDIMSINDKSPTGYFQKLTLNILKNYMNYTMIFHQLQKKNFF